jgi:hypothetical protein
METFDQVVETRFVSDEETLRGMVKELDLREAQMQFADVTARMVNAQHTDPQLCEESEAANKRLFALFEEGFTAGDKLLFKAYYSYKARLCAHHRWES